MSLQSLLEPVRGYLTECNGLDHGGFEWRFYPGMRFGSPEKWWGKGGTRPTPHEGTDFCLYGDRNGRESRLDGGTRIPSLYKGEVRKITDDFLGKSVFVRHNIRGGNGNRLYTLFGHTAPRDDLREGDLLEAEEVFARISVSQKKTTIFPHLHLSVAWVDAAYPDEKITWETLGRTPEIRLINPLDLLVCRHATKKLGVARSSCEMEGVARSSCRNAGRPCTPK